MLADSPNLRVKPRSKKAAKNSCVQLGVECYGGGLWHTWFDRDLSISGKVLLRQNDGTIQHQLFQLHNPVARVSTLCIHLQTAEEREAFKVNKEEHTSPIVALMQPNKELEENAAAQINGDSWREGHEPLLLQAIARTLDIQVSQIADFDLSLYDTHGAALGGFNNEFLHSARLDNLATVFIAIESLVDHSHSLNDDKDISMVVCFDHEEVGSVSSHGAGSPVMAEAIRRISAAFQNGNHTPDLYANTIAKSFCISMDQAHAIHPNYAAKHEAQHAPTLDGGIVIKTNSNQRYTSNSLTGFMIRELSKKISIPIQEFVVRNDCPCGSTIGPTISALTGIRTVDIGAPMLSMHSCREQMSTVALSHGVELCKGFFKHFRSIDDSFVNG